MAEPLTVEAIVADIQANAHYMVAQPELTERLEAYTKATRDALGELALNALLQAMDLIEDTPEADKDLAYRTAASQFVRAGAMVIWGLKQREAQPFRPSSFAVVSYELARHVQASCVANDVGSDDNG